MGKPILNLADAPVDSRSHGAHFQCSQRALADQIGARARRVDAA